MSALPIIAAFGIIGLLAALLGGDKKKSTTTKNGEIPEPEGPTSEEINEVQNTLSDNVKEKLQEYDQNKDPEVIKEAAAIASQEGQTDQAAALQKAYDSARVENGTVTFISPIANLKPEYWTRFVNCLKGNNAKLITPGFALGLFGFGARRLVDVGLMTNPHQGEYKGKTVWTGTWVSPLNINKFLADAALQYKALFASMRDYATRVKNSANVRGLIGKSIDGQAITLSGILGVAHKAGWSGMQKWFASADDRKKFTATTQAFKTCNGIF